jgi:large subunit ribosomal protein L24
MKTKLKKGQTVQLISGADKGKSGEIIKLFPKDYSALVKGINVKKKHQKPTKEQKGGIVNIEKPVHLSNLKVMDDKKKSEKSKEKEPKKTTVKKKEDK